MSMVMRKLLRKIQATTSTAGALSVIANELDMESNRLHAAIDAHDPEDEETDEAFAAGHEHAAKMIRDLVDAMDRSGGQP